MPQTNLSFFPWTLWTMDQKKSMESMDLMEIHRSIALLTDISACVEANLVFDAPGHNRRQICNESKQGDNSVDDKFHRNKWLKQKKSSLTNSQLPSDSANEKNEDRVHCRKKKKNST